MGAIHHGDGLAHGHEFRFLNAGGSEGGDSGLENQAELGEMRRAFLLADFHHKVEGLAGRLGSSVGNKGAAAGVSFDQAFFAQSLHRFAHGGAADAEALREITFGGKLVAGFEGAVENGIFDLLDDLLV
jgi:hypothetical protein